MSQFVSIRVDDRQAQAALSQAPDVIRRYVDGAVRRGAEEIAVEEKRLAPKSLSNLVNAIHVAPSGDLAYAVRQGVAYAAHVILGTGPAVGQPKYYPNPDNLLQYLTTSPRARGFDWAKRGSKKRGGQENEIKRRAESFAWWIYQHGTKPQDFVSPAVLAKRDACVEYVRAATGSAFDEVFGSGTVRFRR